MINMRSRRRQTDDLSVGTPSRFGRVEVVGRIAALVSCRRLGPTAGEREKAAVSAGRRTASTSSWSWRLVRAGERTIPRQAMTRASLRRPQAASSSPRDRW